MVIIYTFVMLIVGFGILHLGSSEKISSFQRRNQARAFYLAEAGVNSFIARINKGDSPANIGGTVVSSGNWQGSYQVILDSEDNPTYAISTGKVKNRTVKIRINLEKGSGGTFSRGVFGDELLSMVNNCEIDSYDSRLGPYGGDNVGDIGNGESNLHIELVNNCKINGDASVSTGDPDDIELRNNSEITGDQEYSSDEKNLPPVDIPETLKQLAYPQQGDGRISGNYSLTNGKFKMVNNKTATISGGDFRFKDFSLRNSCKVDITGNIRFYIEEDFEFINNSKFRLLNDSTAEVYIGSTGRISILNGSELNKTGGNPVNLGIYIAFSGIQNFPNNTYFYGSLYAPSAKVKINNNGNIFGDIVAKEVNLVNNSKIHYDIALRDINPPGDPGGSGEIKITRWSKPDWKERLK